VDRWYPSPERLASTYRHPVQRHPGIQDGSVSIPLTDRMLRAWLAGRRYAADARVAQRRLILRHHRPALRAVTFSPQEAAALFASGEAVIDSATPAPPSPSAIPVCPSAAIFSASLISPGGAQSVGARVMQVECGNADAPEPGTIVCSSSVSVSSPRAWQNGSERLRQRHLSRGSQHLRVIRVHLRSSAARCACVRGRRASRPQTVSGAAVLYTSSAQEDFRLARFYLRSSAFIGGQYGVLVFALVSVLSPRAWQNGSERGSGNAT